MATSPSRAEVRRERTTSVTKASRPGMVNLEDMTSCCALAADLNALANGLAATDDARRWVVPEELENRVAAMNASSLLGQELSVRLLPRARSLVELLTARATPAEREPAVASGQAWLKRRPVDVVLSDAATLWRKLAEQRQKVTLNRTTAMGYRALLQEAQQEVPASICRQIEIDSPRSFSALPPELQARVAMQDAEPSLVRVLLAMEWRQGSAAAAASNRSYRPATYTQGMGFVAAMARAVLKDEDSTFWLLDHLFGECLGPRFYADWPPLFLFHAVADTIVELVPRVCPRLSAALGAELPDFVEMLSLKCLLPCFVGVLPTEPLIAFWTDLLQPKMACTQKPLFLWFLGLLRDLESPLIRSLADMEADDPRPTRLLQSALHLMGGTHWGWRPHGIGVSEDTVLALFQAAERRHLARVTPRAVPASSPHRDQAVGLFSRLALPIGRFLRSLSDFAPRTELDGPPVMPSTSSLELENSDARHNPSARGPMLARAHEHCFGCALSARPSQSRPGCAERVERSNRRRSRRSRTPQAVVSHGSEVEMVLTDSEGMTGTRHASAVIPQTQPSRGTTPTRSHTTRHTLLLRALEGNITEAVSTFSSCQGTVWR